VSRQNIKRIIAAPLYRNSLYLMADTVVTSIFGFVFWVVAARFYSETNVGSASALISSIGLLATFSTFGVNLSIIRFLPSTGNPRRFINTCLTAVALVAILAGGIFVAGVPIWSPALGYVRQNVTLLVAFILIVPFFTMLDLIDSVFMAKRASNLVVLTSSIFAILRIGLLIILAIVAKGFGIVSSWGLALVITLSISFLFLLPRCQSGYKPIPELDIKLLEGLSKYSTASYVASLFSQASTLILPLLVLNVLGAKTNAYYFIAWTIAGVLSAIPFAVSKSLFVEGAHSLQNIKENVTKSLKFTFTLSIPAAIIIVLTAKYLLLAFGPAYSTNALTLLWLLSLGNVLRGVYQIYISMLRIQDKLKELIIIQGLSSSATIISCYWGAKIFGLIGIGYAWLLTQMIISAIIGIRLTFQMRKLQNVEAPQSKQIE
jgi:O-antigen/teichoic acid export membrane protein